MLPHHSLFHPRRSTRRHHSSSLPHPPSSLTLPSGNISPHTQQSLSLSLAVPPSHTPVPLLPDALSSAAARVFPTLSRERILRWEVLVTPSSSNALSSVRSHRRRSPPCQSPHTRSQLTGCRCKAVRPQPSTHTPHPAPSDLDGCVCALNRAHTRSQSLLRVCCVCGFVGLEFRRTETSAGWRV